MPTNPRLQEERHASAPQKLPKEANPSSHATLRALQRPSATAYNSLSFCLEHPRERVRLDLALHSLALPLLCAGPTRPHLEDMRHVSKLGQPLYRPVKYLTEVEARVGDALRQAHRSANRRGKLLLASTSGRRALRTHT